MLTITLSILLHLQMFLLAEDPYKNQVASIIFKPKFSAPIVNLSIAVGREATFKCYVQQLGHYKVGWIKADTKAIQAIDETVITHNSRISVSHEGFTVWKLHIKDVKEEDMGLYMCQINTDPMTSQVGYLDVLIPPDFVPNLTSSDLITTEGNTIRLHCTAKGRPEPKVIWRREDGKDILLRKDFSAAFSRWDDTVFDTNDEELSKGLASKIKVPSYQGEILKFVRISRQEMGPYLCIASNGVPPSISKRIIVHVHFSPKVQIPNQLVGAPLYTQVTIECFIESYPKAIAYWVRDTGQIITSSSKYQVQTKMKSLYEVHLYLIIYALSPEDLGTYQCVAKNSLGEVDSNIRLYEIPGPTQKYMDDEKDDIKKEYIINSNKLLNRFSDKEDISLAKIRHSKHTNRVQGDLSFLSSSVKTSDALYSENYSTYNQTKTWEEASSCQHIKNSFLTIIFSISISFIIY